MRMMIATPVISSEPTEHVDEWDMLMCDLRDDVPRVADMPGCSDTAQTIEILGDTKISAFVFRFEVDDELGQQLLDSAYASCEDVIIRKED